MVRKLHRHKVGHIKTVNSVRLLKFSKFEKQYFVDSCESYLTMLGTELALDPKKSCYSSQVLQLCIRVHCHASNLKHSSTLVKLVT